MARITDLCQEVRDILADRLPAADSVERSYLFGVATVSFDGKTLRVFGTGYATAQRVTRNRVHREYTLSVEVEEPYKLPADSGTDGPIPADWLDDRIDWVEANVFNILDNEGIEPATRLLGAFWPQTCEVTVLYDPVQLQDKIFRSVVTLAYREQVEG